MNLDLWPWQRSTFQPKPSAMKYRTALERLYRLHHKKLESQLDQFFELKKRKQKKNDR